MRSISCDICGDPLSCAFGIPFQRGRCANAREDGKAGIIPLRPNVFYCITTSCSAGSRRNVVILTQEPDLRMLVRILHATGDDPLVTTNKRRLDNESKGCPDCSGSCGITGGYFTGRK